MEFERDLIDALVQNLGFLCVAILGREIWDLLDLVNEFKVRSPGSEVLGREVSESLEIGVHVVRSHFVVLFPFAIGE